MKIGQVLFKIQAREAWKPHAGSAFRFSLAESAPPPLRRSFRGPPLRVLTLERAQINARVCLSVEKFVRADTPMIASHFSPMTSNPSDVAER